MNLLSRASARGYVTYFLGGYYPRSIDLHYSLYHTQPLSTVVYYFTITRVMKVAHQ